MKYFKESREIFQNFLDILKYLKVKYFIVHPYVRLR